MGVAVPVVVVMVVRVLMAGQTGILLFVDRSWEKGARRDSRRIYLRSATSGDMLSR